MSKRTIYVDQATWDGMVERAVQRGMERDRRPLSVSAYLRELYEADHPLSKPVRGGTKTESHGLQEDEAKTQTSQPPRRKVAQAATRADKGQDGPYVLALCARRGCLKDGTSEHAGYCSASHRIADEQGRKR